MMWYRNYRYYYISVRLQIGKIKSIDKYILPNSPDHKNEKKIFS